MDRRVMAPPREGELLVEQWGEGVGSGGGMGNSMEGRR